MTINYDSKNDLLYLRLDQKHHQVMNKRVSDEVVLDIGEDGKIIGIEIMDASKHIQLDTLLPIGFENRKAS
jgi:uncharacterized protein YuzE